MEAGEDPDAVEQVERGRLSAQELSWSLRSVNRAAGELDQALAAQLGLRFLDYAAMGHVMSREGSPLGPVELGQRLGISTGSATELVDRLERSGHVVRARETADRRRVSVIPQDESVNRILDELRPLITALDELASQFSDEEQLAIDRYLRTAAQLLTSRAQDLASSPPSDMSTSGDGDVRLAGQPADPIS